MFQVPNNRDRAAWAREALAAFEPLAYFPGEGGSFDDVEPLETRAKDLITNLLHLVRLDREADADNEPGVTPDGFDASAFVASAALMHDIEADEDGDGDDLLDGTDDEDEDSDLDEGDALDEAEAAAAFAPALPPVPASHPVQPVEFMSPEYHEIRARGALAQCGACSRMWDDGTPTSMTPTPSGRCPFEYYHADASPAEWSGSPDPDSPDTHWIDDATGERVDAVTGERTPPPCAPGRHTDTGRGVCADCGDAL